MSGSEVFSGEWNTYQTDFHGWDTKFSENAAYIGGPLAVQTRPSSKEDLRYKDIAMSKLGITRTHSIPSFRSTEALYGFFAAIGFYLIIPIPNPYATVSQQTKFAFRT